ILCCRKGHIRNQNPLYWWILSRIYKRHYTFQLTGIFKQVFEIQIVIICKSHTSKNDLVSLCSKCHICHHRVIGLVRDGKEWDLLSSTRCIVKVNTCNTSSHQFRRLLTPYRVNRGATYLTTLTFSIGSPINRVTVGSK